MPDFITKEELLKLGFIPQDIVESDDPLEDCIYQVFVHGDSENRVEITNDLNENYEIINQYMDVHIESQDLKNPKRMLGQALHLLSCINERYIVGKPLHGITVNDIEYVKGH